MTGGRGWLVKWLRDAHAMEEQAETMLCGQLSRIENYPELAELASYTFEHKEIARICAESLREEVPGPSG